jgi:hypothetical protein
MNIELVREYRWLNIPTGSRGTGQTTNPVTRLALLEQLNTWNGSNPGVWQYWAVV